MIKLYDREKRGILNPFYLFEKTPTCFLPGKDEGRHSPPLPVCNRSALSEKNFRYFVQYLTKKLFEKETNPLDIFRDSE